MKVVAVNGSPKPRGSTSEKVIKQMEKLLNTEIETHQALPLTRGQTPPEAIEAMLRADTLLIVFPLYIDALHTSLIELLTRLEDAARTATAKPKVFAIVNCGYFESHHNVCALKMVEHFANRAGLAWGCGLGIGCGGMLSSLGESWEKGPASSIYNAMRDIADMIQSGKSGQNLFAVPKIPRLLGKVFGNAYMRSEAKKNGAKDLWARPYAKSL